MAYTYRNVKTKEVITTSNKISGKNWKPVEETILHSEDDDQQEDTTLENSNTEETEDETEDKTAAGETPEAKPRRARRSNK